MKNFYYSFLIISLAIISSTQAQKKDAADTLVFHHVSSGMTQSSATQIHEDKYGFLWIGTTNGINKYDGTSFQNFKKIQKGNDGLTNGYIQAIHEDSEGKLYIGTNRGLNIYDRVINTVKPYPFKKEGKLFQTKFIGAVFKSEDALWIGTYYDGVYKYQTSTGAIQQLSFNSTTPTRLNNNFIVEIFPLEKNKILVVTQTAFYILDEKMKVLQRSSSYDISSAFAISRTAFWAGTYSGRLIKIEVDGNFLMEQETIPITPNHTILSIEEDENGRVWIGSENAGLSIYSSQQNEILKIESSIYNPNTIKSNSIWSIYRSRNGTMWLGAYKQGLSLYDPHFYKFDHMKANPLKKNWLNNNIINCFLEDEKENFWIGTDGGGLNYWDRKSNSFNYYSLDNGKIASNVILSIYRDNKGRLWLGTWGDGLIIFDPSNGTEEVWTTNNSFLQSDNVFSIIEDSKGRIWIATLFGGLHMYYPDTHQFKNFNLKTEKDSIEVITPARILEDEEGNVWVGTQREGIFRLKETEKNWNIEHYEATESNRSISHDFINVIYQDLNGAVWVGTQAGLNRYNKETQDFTIFSEENGLLDYAIMGIIEDEEGLLWLSTNQGIIRFQPNTGQLTSYDLYDGLQGNTFNASSSYITSTNEFIFGGSNGFNIFELDQAKKLRDEPPIYFYSLKVFNKPIKANDELGVLSRDISQTDSISFSHKHSVINFNFRSITFRHPYRVKYAYYLEGFETSWNYVNTPSATYTNLSPGEYMLKVKSTNSDGIWNDQISTIYIRIKPPYWMTWWFRLTIVMFILFSIYIIHLIRISRIKKYQAQLETEIEARTKELKLKQNELIKTTNKLANKNEEIQRFTVSVSHDLKSPLGTIKGLSEIISQNISKLSTDEIKTYLDYINTSCDIMEGLIIDVTEIARIGEIKNRIEHLDTNNIVKTARNLVLGKLQQKKVELIIEENLPSISGDKNRLIQVFGNLLDNAIKYMGEQKRPTVKVFVKRGDQTNDFVVEDNGSGISKESLARLFSPFERFDKSVDGTGLGLYMIQKIVQSHGGKIEAKSDGKGKGSRFTVSMPVVPD